MRSLPFKHATVPVAFKAITYSIALSYGTDRLGL